MAGADGAAPELLVEPHARLAPRPVVPRRPAGARRARLRLLPPARRGARALPAPARKAARARARSSSSCGSRGCRRRPGCAPGRRALDLCDRAIPLTKRVQRFVRDEHPDVVLVTPHLMPASTDVHYARSAAATGVPTAICVASWDNLSSKQLLRVVPDLVTVWNDTQKEEAVGLHGVPADRVVVDRRAVLRPLVRLAAAAAGGVLRARRARPVEAVPRLPGRRALPDDDDRGRLLPEVDRGRARERRAGPADGEHPDPAPPQARRGVADARLLGPRRTSSSGPRTSSSPPSRRPAPTTSTRSTTRAVAFGINTTRDDRGRDHRQGGAHDHRARVRRLAGRRAPLPLPAGDRRRARPGLRDARRVRPSARRRRRRPRHRGRGGGAPVHRALRPAERRPGAGDACLRRRGRGTGRARAARAAAGCAAGSCSCARRSR